MQTLKRFVNGNEADLGLMAGVSVKPFGDRLIVKGPSGAESAVALRDGEVVLISFRGRQFKIEKAARKAAAAARGSGSVSAPMPGLIVDVLVKECDQVQKGQKLVVLEAMKTQQALTSPFPGVVKAVKVSVGEQVLEGQLLAEVEAE